MQWWRDYSNNPQKRWAEFKLGLIVFVLGAILILGGAKYWIWLQIPGLLVLACGALIAAKGYLGMLLFRLTAGLRNAKPPACGDDKDK